MSNIDFGVLHFQAHQGDEDFLDCLWMI